MLKLAFIGGTDKIGESLFYLEYKKEAIVIDAGISFPNELSFLNITKIVPNMEFIEQNKEKIKGIFISHPHDDHVGALVDLLKIVNVPIYADNLCINYIKGKLRLDELYTLIPINKTINFKYISITPFKTKHSTIGTLGYIISLKGKGNKNIIFTGDIKLGENETETLAELKNLKLPINPYILITESTNADKEGYANAEKYVIDNLDKIIKQNNKELFIITTFASNIERLQGIVEIAKKYKKRIVILGKSLFYSFNFMKKNNLIDYDNIYINTDNIKVTCTENDIVIVTGNQGENNSGLTRINELLYVPKKIRKNIIFSSSIIPGNEVKIRELKIQLLKKGYNIIDDNIYHVSGHMSKNELNMLIKYLKPHFYIPIHGDYIKQLANKNIAIKYMNSENILILENGNIVKFNENNDKININKLNNIDKKTYYYNKNEIITEEILETKINLTKGIVTFILLPNKKKIITRSVGVTEKVLKNITFIRNTYLKKKYLIDKRLFAIYLNKKYPNSLEKPQFLFITIKD